MKILMATDGSADAATALRSAVRVMALKDAEVDVLCVTPKFEPPYSGWETGSVRERFSHRARQLARRVAARAEENLRAGGLEANQRVESGSPAELIVKLSTEYDAVVIGAKGKGTSPNTGLGPVASRVLEHAASPLFIGREIRSDSGFRVLVATDGSDASNEAIDQLGSLVDLSQADIRILHVVESPWLHLGDEQELFGFDEPEHEAVEPEVRVEREMTIEADRLVEEARVRLGVGRRAAVSVAVESGLPATEILSELDRADYDLVVLGSSGGDDLKHRLLGSVSAKVAWDAPCSVLVVRA